MFQPQRFAATPAHERVYGLYERVYTAVDAGAAFMFVIGSALFFSEATKTAATWMFLIGSLFFAARPTVRLLREYHLARLPLPGDDES